MKSPDTRVKVVHKIKITDPDCHRSKVRYEGTGDLTLDDLVVLRWDKNLEVDAQGAVNESSLKYFRGVQIEHRLRQENFAGINPGL